jgi:DNA-binding CsgD family transcriptional regulator
MRADEGRVVVSLRRSVLDQAVRGVLTAQGWTIESASEPHRELPSVVDDGSRRGVPHRTVLVCPATPVGCAGALRRLVAGHVGAVVPEDRLAVLPEVLAELRRRRTLLELDVIELAALVPTLDARHRAVLEGLLAGQSAADIATQSYLSPATVKRAVSLLLRKFGVRSGLQLTRRAASLGFQPREVHGPIP